MTRLIDADALLEVLNSKEIINLRHVKDLITNAPTVQREGWVSVEDRLPECKHEDTSDEVMVSDSLMIAGPCVDGSIGVGIGHYQLNGKWICYASEHDYFNIETVTHWMPLLAAPAVPTDKE